jgi:hypothetical protein
VNPAPDIEPAGLDAARARLRGTPLHSAWRWLRSAAGAVRHRDDLAGVDTYCVFLGHARSGHSIVGALLDAHPSIVISDELDALAYLGRGFRRDQLLYLSLMVAHHQAKRKRTKQGRSGQTYSYHVPGQFQGRYEGLRVVGDSRAGWSTRRLVESPELLDRLERTMHPATVKFVHVVRNPFDNISTMMLRAGRTREEATRRYLEGCQRLAEVRHRIPAERLLTIRHEEIIAAPDRHLVEACRFLGVEPHAGWVAACAGTLYRSPSRSRDAVEWDASSIGGLEQAMKPFAFLDGYRHAD